MEPRTYLGKDRRAILLYMGLLAIAVSLINPSWLYDPYGSIDHWAYLGEMVSFPRLRLLFPGHPAGDLLPLILPGALLYRLFPPFAANYLQDVLFLALALVCLFGLIQDGIDTATAAVTVSFAAGYQFFLAAIGSDYTDGKVIPYYLLALYFTSVARKDDRRFVTFAMLSGAAFALMVFTAALSLVYAPVIVLFCAMRGVRRLIRFLPFFILGGFLMTASLSAVNFLCTGKFIFFANTLAKMFQFAHFYTPPPLKTWAPHASWLVLPFLTVIANFIFIIHDRDAKWDERHAFAVMNIASLCIMVGVEVIFHQSTLQHLYFDQTLPLTFLGLAVILSGQTSSNVSNAGRFLIGVALMLSGAVLVGVRAYSHDLQMLLMARLGGGHLPVVLGLGAVGVLGIGVLLYACQTWDTPWARGAVLAMAAVINLFSFSPSFSAPPVAGEPQLFLTTVKWLGFFDTVDPNRVGLFWYNMNEPYGLLIQQFYTASDLNIKALRINPAFPSLDEFTHPMEPLPPWRQGQEGNPPKPGDVIIVCSHDPNAIAQARTSLAAFGIRVKSYTVYPFPNDLATFDVTKIQTDAL